MIETERLVLRRWRAEDVAPLAAIHADPAVMRWLGGRLLDRAETEAYLATVERHFEAHGFGFWAVERRADGALLGFSGLRVFDFDGHPMGSCVEIGWRQGLAHWGQGYATEAARAALEDGFVRAGLDEILAWTARTNLRSQAVMARIGMTRRPERDFDHPLVAEGDPLRPHVVFAARP